MESILQDLRYGARTLIKNPGFTLVAVIALALGIGANTAIFSVINALLLRPLSYGDPDRLVILWNRAPGLNIPEDWLSIAQYIDIKTQNNVFDEIAISLGSSFNLTGEAMPERVEGLYASSSMFPLLAVQAAHGRVFLPEEDEPGKPPVILISHSLWQRRYGADANMIGKTLALNGQPRTVAGIMPADFSLGKEVMPTVGGITRADVILPLPLSAEAMSNRRSENYNVLARLKPGVTVSQAQAEIDTITDRLKQQYPQYYPPHGGFTISAVPLLEQVVGNIRPALLVLLGAVGFVLLIACANVANLLLARAAARQKEIAIRTAVGAGRLRLIRQLLTESLLLAITGGGAGLLVAIWGIDALRLLSPGNIPRMNEIGIDGRVITFTFAVSLLTGVIFGLAPALRASRIDLNETLKEGGRSASSGPRGGRVRNLLVVSEVALSLVLLIGAGLLIRSFAQLQKVDPGFSAENVLSLRVSLSGAGYRESASRAAFFKKLWDKLESLPGVESVGGVTTLPLSPGVGWGSIVVEGYAPAPGEDVVNADQRIAGHNYFRAMKIPLVRGRYFDERDTPEALPVVIIDESMAERFWPGDDPIGKRLKPGGSDSTDPWLTIVGVVGHVKQYALDADSRIAIYYPHTQEPSSSLYIAVRTASSLTSLASAITSEVRAIDPDLPVYELNTMEQRISDSLARRRFSMLMLGLFAAVAMLLAMVGIYGVMSYAVSQRKHEIGIRVALGASYRDILKLLVGEGLVMALIGVSLGLVASLALTRFLSSLLFGVSTTDPIVFAAVPLLLTGVTLLACYIPAQRATRVDPMEALRYE